MARRLRSLGIRSAGLICRRGTQTRLRQTHEGNNPGLSLLSLCWCCGIIKVSVASDGLCCRWILPTWARRKFLSRCAPSFPATHGVRANTLLQGFVTQIDSIDAAPLGRPAPSTSTQPSHSRGRGLGGFGRGCGRIASRGGRSAVVREEAASTLMPACDVVETTSVSPKESPGAHSFRPLRMALHPLNQEAASSQGCDGTGRAMPSSSASADACTGECELAAVFVLPLSQGSATRATLCKTQRTFQNIASYQRVFSHAVCQQVQFQLDEMAAVVAKNLAEQPARVVNTQALQRRLHTAAVSMITDVKVEAPFQVSFKAGRKRAADEMESEPDAAGPTPNADLLFLRLPAVEPRAKYAQGDLWVVSSRVTCDNVRGSGGFVFVGVSMWHGPSKDSVLAIRPLLPARAAELHRLLGKGRSGVFCFRGPNVAGELRALANLKSLGSSQPPLLEHMLQPVGVEPSAPLANGGLSRRPRAKFPLPTKMNLVEMMSIFANVVDDFGLSEEQQSILRAVLSWFDSSAERPNRVVLLEGVFGAGKSSTLAAVLCLLCRVLDGAADKETRILLCANTNVAVDNVLLSVASHGVDSFVRVGNLRKIDKSLLKYTASGAGALAVDIEQVVRERLAEGGTAVSDGEFRSVAHSVRVDNTKRLGQRTARLVGVTCASASLPVLDDAQFSIVILDESSQMIEPDALLAIGRFGAECCLMAGDPHQVCRLYGACVHHNTGAPACAHS